MKTSTPVTAGGWLALAAALLGWMAAGMEMALMVPTARPAIQFFLGANTAGIEILADQWLSWFVAAFLLGAALGGLVFGWLGDRWGRVRALAGSVLCFALFTGFGYWAQSPEQLLILRFFACLGIGGTWPNGVALVGETLPQLSRPWVAGLIGASANVGFLILGFLMLGHPITKDSWRWVMLVGAVPLLLSVFIGVAVPESPEWLRRQKVRPRGVDEPPAPAPAIWRPPLLRLTVLGILLGTIPLLGGWASGQRLVPWAGQVAERAGLPDLKAATQTSLALGAVIGSLIGGWVASRIGKQWSFFAISGLSLLLSLITYLRFQPTDPLFNLMVLALGCVSTMYYGWLPYFLPQIFPTSIRATGIGVSFNFGRILSAAAVLGSTGLSHWFGGDIAKMGAVLSLIYAGGLVLAFLIPEPPEAIESLAD